MAERAAFSVMKDFLLLNTTQIAFSNLFKTTIITLLLFPKAFSKDMYNVFFASWKKKCNVVKELSFNLGDFMFNLLDRFF